MYKWFVFVTIFQIVLPSVKGSTILGNVFCDKCWDSRIDSKVDEPIAWTKVTANCTIRSDTKSTFIVVTGNTIGDGSFRIGIEGATNDAFLNALYSNGNPTNGLLPGGTVTGCNVKVECENCEIQSFNDGKCIGGGIQGNGRASSVDLVNFGSDTADIRINGPICYSPKKKSGNCPANPRLPPGASGDPHFTGADGSRFSFEGEPNSTFCLVSDKNIQINAYYGGRWDRYGNSTVKSLTWIRQIGILWGRHTIVLAAREGATWLHDKGYMASIKVNDKEVKLGQAGDLAFLSGGVIQILWVASKVRTGDDIVDVYQVTIADILKLRVKIRPEVQLLRSETDGVLHVDLELPVLDVSDEVHGILGQTFRTDHRDRLAMQKIEWNDSWNAHVVLGDNAEGFLDGNVSDYKTSDLLQTDCRYCRFVRSQKRHSETTKVIDLMTPEVTATDKNGNGKKLTTGRRLLGLNDRLNQWLKSKK